MAAVLVSVSFFLVLAGGYVALIAWWRWLGEQGEKRHATERFERDFIPEAADVAATERKLGLHDDR